MRSRRAEVRLSSVSAAEATSPAGLKPPGPDTGQLVVAWLSATVLPIGVAAAFIPLRAHVAATDVALLLTVVILVAAIQGGHVLGAVAASSPPSRSTSSSPAKVALLLPAHRPRRGDRDRGADAHRRCRDRRDRHPVEARPLRGPRVTVESSNATLASLSFVGRWRAAGPLIRVARKRAWISST